MEEQCYEWLPFNDLNVNRRWEYTQTYNMVEPPDGGWHLLQVVVDQYGRAPYYVWERQLHRCVVQN